LRKYLILTINLKLLEKTDFLH